MKTITREELQDTVDRYNGERELLPNEDIMTVGEMADIEGMVVVDCPHITACTVCQHYESCGGYSG